MGLGSGVEPWDMPPDPEQRADRAEIEIERLRRAVWLALKELGVPGPGYPAPVANAVGILRRALLEAGNGA